MSLKFAELEKLFRNNDFPTIEADSRGIRFLKRKVSEDQREKAKEFISSLKQEKRTIIQEAEENPADLKKWLYENQGEARFDASNRFFLVLTDESDMFNSWKLKRNIVFLRDCISSHLDGLSMDMGSLETTFYWKSDKKTYSCKSDILFLKYGKRA